MTRITKEELDELKEKIENATPGPWTQHDESARLVDGADGRGVAMTTKGRKASELIGNGAFIAAADPGTVAALIHTIERQHEVLRSVLKAVDEGHITAGEDFILKLSGLVKELEA